MDEGHRERPPAWTTVLLLVVAVTLAVTAAGTAVSAAQQSGLPVASARVVAVEDGTCGRSGPCSRPVVLLPGTSRTAVVDGIHWPVGALDRVGTVVEVRYGARAGRVWAAGDLALTTAVAGVCAVLAALAAAAGVLSRTHP